MIETSTHFDLGKDRSRIKDPRDAERQHATVDEILRRMFHDDPAQRSEIQLIADEVGMGKTFVALAVAYSIVEHIMTHGRSGDLKRCYAKALVLTPQNSALFQKWGREVSEFVRRCVKDEHRKKAETWFAPQRIDRLDDLAVALTRPGNGPSVLVAPMSILSGKLRHYDLKRRFVLGVLFRHWGTRFKVDDRRRLLKAAPGNWPQDPYELCAVSDEEAELLPFDESEMLKSVQALDQPDDDDEVSPVEELLELCQEAAACHRVADRAAGLEKINKRLGRLYRDVCIQAVRRAVPVLIVDEAHNWKNGPKHGANGFAQFAEWIAPRVRRALLLTATPFQLRPEEMLELLKVGEHIRPAPKQATADERTGELRRRREEVIAPVLRNAARASRAFARAWSRLPSTMTTGELETLWQREELAKLRDKLWDLAAAEGALDVDLVEKEVVTATTHLDPHVREFIREALKLYAFNSDLSVELGAVVVRHRRRMEHRLYRVGAGYRLQPEEIAVRPDSHLFHAAPGLDVRGDGELPHYLLMRCVSERKQGKGRSSLGSALTGCYSTLLHSAEGKSIQESLAHSDVGKAYLDLLMDLVKESHDPDHPKLKEVVDSAVAAWRAGEKTLLFCFRTNTARRLHEILRDKVQAELEERRNHCLGGPEQLETLKRRFTGRDRDLIVIGLDRVLWSYAWAAKQRGEAPVTPEDLRLLDADLEELSRVALRFGVDLDAQRVDRVFLNRAHEHVVARRLLANKPGKGDWRSLLERMADEAWVARPYGLRPPADDEPEEAGFDGRGVHQEYVARQEPPAEEVRALAERLHARRQRATADVSIFDVYVGGPSLWLGTQPTQTWADPASSGAGPIERLHRHLWEISPGAQDSHWQGRAMLFQALRRAFLRDPVLLRLLPSRTDRAESSWGELLVQAFSSPLPGQNESVFDRLVVFLEDVRAASGELTDRSSARHAIYSATKVSAQQMVARVDGATKADTRERFFAGFNTPLDPEILVCTSVGQEGIDLHRHCRRVVHYDLAWNPAVLEQRTGRADRIGSKTFRERKLGNGNEGPHLEVGVPFLAGTYDERMYEELRLRAQTFEVLTGGDLAADSPEGRDDIRDADGEEAQLHFVPLPQDMVGDLRVQLAVWKDRKPPPPAAPSDAAPDQVPAAST